MRYFQHRRQLALQAGVIMFEGTTLPDRLTLLLGTYLRAKELESAINHSFTDDRGNTFAFLEVIRERLVSHHAKQEAEYIRSIAADFSTHSLHYEEVLVNRISFMLMEWPEDDVMQDAWARCPINSPLLSDVMAHMWPELLNLESNLPIKTR